MYVVELEGFTGDNRIFDKVGEDNEKNAVDYAKKKKEQCLNIGINTKIVVEMRYYDFKSTILEL